MSPRPRKASDAEVFAATQRVMTRVAPRGLSLTEIAAEAGITAGALVQRFGSKRGLLLAVAEKWAEGTGKMLAELRARCHSPVAALKLYAEAVASMGKSPSTLANHLAYLQMDLADAAFLRAMQANADVTRATLEEWVAEAVRVGELDGDTDVTALARLVEATVKGSLMSWVVLQEESAVKWVLKDVDALLAPHMSAARLA